MSLLIFYIILCTATIQGYSVVPDIEASSSSTLPLLQRCNYHSNMVLRAILNEYDPETSTNTVSTDMSEGEKSSQISFLSFFKSSLDAPSDSTSSLKLTPSQLTQETRLPGTSICSLAQQMAAWNTQQLVRLIQ